MSESVSSLHNSASLIYRPTEDVPVFDDETGNIEMDPELAFQDALDHANSLVAEWARRREEIAVTLMITADELDTVQKKCNITSTVGSSVGIAGGIATIAGMLLMPPVAIAGAIVGGAGAVTSLTAGIVNFVTIRKHMKAVEPLIEKDKVLWDLIIKAWEEVERLFSLRRTQGPDGPSIGPMGTSAAALGASGLAGIGIKAFIAESARLTPKIAQTLAHTAAVVGIVLDTYSLITTAKDMVDGSKSEYANKLREFASQIENEKRSVLRMNTMYQLDEES